MRQLPPLRLLVVVCALFSSAFVVRLVRKWLRLLTTSRAALDLSSRASLPPPASSALPPTTSHTDRRAAEIGEGEGEGEKEEERDGEEVREVEEGAGGERSDATSPEEEEEEEEEGSLSFHSPCSSPSLFRRTTRSHPQDQPPEGPQERPGQAHTPEPQPNPNDPEFLSLLRVAHHHRRRLPVCVYLDACTCLVGVFSSLGGAFSFAASGVQTYVEVVLARAGEFVEREQANGHTVSLEAVTVQQLVIDEIERAVTALNAGKGKGVKISASREVLRLIWMFNFVSVFFANLACDLDAPLDAVVRDAYDRSLKTRHGWVERAAVATALRFLPSRQHFTTQTGFGRGGEDEQAQFAAIHNLIEGMHHEIWGMFRRNKIDNLK